MKRKKKLYARPKTPFQSTRIQEENVLVAKYGLKNKKEVWKTLAKVNYFRKRAMALARGKDEEQKVFFGKLNGIGLKVESTADVLDLQVEDLLKRRLPTIVASKGVGNTVKHSRQLVVHKKVLVDGKVVNSPSFIVPVALEGKIKIKEKTKKVPKVEKVGGADEKVSEDKVEAPVVEAKVEEPQVEESVGEVNAEGKVDEDKEEVPVEEKLSEEKVEAPVVEAKTKKFISEEKVEENPVEEKKKDDKKEEEEK
jgi:small subunit ribosomal protein S4